MALPKIVSDFDPSGGTRRRGFSGEIGPVRCFEFREVRKETSASEWIWWG
jgi:hypothetical protein